MTKRDETKLPLWVKASLTALRWQVQHLETIRDMQAITAERDWFVLPSSNDLATTVLYILRDNAAIAVCSLGQGDALFVGRAKAKTAERREALRKQAEDLMREKPDYGVEE